MRAPLLASAVLLALTQAPSQAVASGPASSEEESSELAEAKKLYQDGKTAFETGEYEDALKSWKDAFKKLDDRAEFQTIRHTLVFNISAAHIRIYEVNRDVTHLRKAKTLLEQYLANHTKLYGDDETARNDRASSEQKLAEVNAMLEDADANGGAASGTPARDDGIAPQVAIEMSPKQKRMLQIKEDPKLRKEDKKYMDMTIAGAVLTGVGGLGVLGIGTGTGVAGYATLGGGVVLLAVGIPILAVGQVKQGKLRKPLPQHYAPASRPTATGEAASETEATESEAGDAQARVRSIRVAPWGGRKGGGVAFGMRF